MATGAGAGEEGPSFPGFPFTPYPIQMDFMHNLYQTLEQGQIGLFESPTGTGKTLSIICSVLQWLQDYRQTLEAVEAAEQEAAQCNRAADPDLPAWMLEQQHKQKQLQRQQEQQKHADAAAAAAEHRRAHRRKAEISQLGAGAGGDSSSYAADTADEFILEQRSYSSSDDDSDADDLLKERDQASLLRKVPQVIFCSRTHSQLSQFVGEMNCTPFADWVELVALGSRKNLCLNDSVLRLKQPQLINERCMDLQRKRSSKAHATGSDARPLRSKQRGGCPFLRAPPAAASSFQDALLAAPIDLEELARLGRQQAVCPYYGSRRAVPRADVLLVPYSAVLQPDTRQALGIELEGSVIIFDEAHNLLDAINGAHSATVTAVQLSSAVSQLSAYFERYKTRLSPGNASQLQLLLHLARALLECLRSDGPGSTCEPAAGSIASNSSSAAVPGITAGSSCGKVLTCSRFLIELSLDHINLFPLLDWIRESKVMFKVSGLAASTAQAAGSMQLHTPASAAGSSAMGAEAAAGQESESKDSTGSLHAFAGFLQALTNTNSDGRVIIEHQHQSQAGISAAAAIGSAATMPGTAPSTTAGKSSVSAIRTRPNGQLRFVLLNAAGHFSQILKGARSVVLASGTLAPVEALGAQLFPGLPQTSIRHFECGHVIDAGNLVALAVGKGPAGGVLDFRHEQRGSNATMDEAGRLLLNLCSLVPQGLVAFAPSFAFCQQLLQRWESTGVLQLIQSKKRFFMEPRTSSEVEVVLQQYSACIQEGQGALLLSVVGGKLSEGINFGDGLGRCVVVLGMPYPNPSDSELQERMHFLDTASKAGRPGITGREYYDNLCMNAVNQCVGRVIRHKNDYAAIVLADARFVQQRVSGRSPIQKLPRWIQASFIPTNGGFGAVHTQLKAFFAHKYSKPQQDVQLQPTA